MTKSKKIKILLPVQKQGKKKQTKKVGAIKGHGDYYSETIKPFLQRNVPKGSLSKIGAMVGAHLGGPAGSAFGGYGGGKLAELVGFGDYSVGNNSLGKECGALPMGEEVPRFVSSGRGTRIVHREYVGDILSAGLPFSLTGYDLSPLNGTVFPWMSNIAQLYQQYKFNGMVFEFKTMSSEYSNTSALGTVVMTTNYNANQPLFDNKLEMENTEFAVSSKPSLSQMHCIECDPKERVTEYLYVQPTVVGIGANDKRLTSFGTMQLATTGLSSQNGSVIGELWVSYDITLLKPVLNVAPAQPSSSTFTNTSSPSYANLFGTAPITLNAPTAAALYNPLVPNVFVIPAVGTYLIFLQATAFFTVAIPYSITGSGITFTTLNSIFNVTAGASQQLARVVTTAANTPVTFSLPGMTGTLSQVAAKWIRVDGPSSGF